MGSLFNDQKTNDGLTLEEVHTVQVPTPPVGSRPFTTESWTCAWSPDGSLFAWSYGNRSVKIIPWSRIKAKDNFFSPEDFAPTVRSGSKDAHFIELKQTLADSTPGSKRGNHDLDHVVTINCGHAVHSVAFGGGQDKRKAGANHVISLRHVNCLVLATGLVNGRLRVWDAATGGLLWELMDHRDIIGQLKFSPVTMDLASACKDGTVKLWDLTDDGNMYKTLRACKIGHHWASACSWSPNGNYLATVGSNKTAVIWEMTNYKIYRKLEGHHNDVLDCDFSPDGALLATCSYDTRAILWETDTGDQIRVFYHLYPVPHPIFAGGENEAFVRSLSYCKDGMHLTTVCDDGYVRVWNTEKDDKPVMTTKLDGICCVYRPQKDVLAVGTKSGAVTFYHGIKTINTLKKLCRVAIRRNISYRGIDTLMIPIRHKEFLKYHCDL